MTSWFVKITASIGNALGKIRDNYLNIRDALGSKKRLVDEIIVDERIGKRRKVVSYVTASLSEVKKERNQIVRNLNESLVSLVDGDFGRDDMSELCRISKDYSDMFGAYRGTGLKGRESFLGTKNKKALITLESLARARAAFLRKRTDLSFKEFLEDILKDKNLISTKDNMGGNDGGYALVTEYGTMHSYILDSVLDFSTSGRKQAELTYKAGEKNWEIEMEKARKPVCAGGKNESDRKYSCPAGVLSHVSGRHEKKS